ncbi:MAG: 4Fe-4S binding protein, partial [Acetobacterium sp.]|nr:4Fe-4S binding protein [Acetobacterium sp.]
IPLVIKNENLRQAVGFLFNWKISLLAVTIISSIFIYRPFCKFICPLGAMYSVFNKFSFYQMNVDKIKCNGCKECERSCKMNVEITKSINSLECIRCGECKKVCKQGAINSGFSLRTNKKVFHVNIGTSYLCHENIGKKAE